MSNHVFDLNTEGVVLLRDGLNGWGSALDGTLDMLGRLDICSTVSIYVYRKQTDIPFIVRR